MKTYPITRTMAHVRIGIEVAFTETELGHNFTREFTKLVGYNWVVSTVALEDWQRPV